jgi:hypothetical protein
MAAGMGDEILHLLDPRPFRFALTPDVMDAASERWRETFTDLQRETMGVFIGIVRDAIASDDLPADTAPDLVAASAWSLSCGANELYEAGLIMRGLAQPEFARSRSRMFLALLDGFGWKPYSANHDYEATRRRILSEVFGPEARQLGLLDAEPEAKAPA